MAYRQQAQKYIPKHRYSIRQLLALSVTATIPFDLSKFSYDAARAGVVPSLCDCAMSSRKSSEIRTRDWSLGTTATEDLVIHKDINENQVGSERIAVQEPLREPSLPPSIEKQRDEGFARFLKKHSSPTHQRVTAGGRIVPMEPHSSPPAFGLHNRLSPKVEDSQLKVCKNNLSYLASNDQSLLAATSTQAMNFSIPQHKDLGFAEVGQGGSFNQEFIMPSPATGQPVRCPVPNLPYASMDGLSIGSSWLPGQYDGPLNTSNMHRNMPYGYSSTYGGYGPALDRTPTFDNAYLCRGTNATGISYNVHQHATQDLLNQPIQSAQLSLAFWQQRYVELEQQLKDMDRHRAMGELNSVMAEQRRVVVQQRSDVKDMISNIKTFLGLSHGTESSTCSFSGGLNVDAPVYVPSTHLLSSTHLPISQDGEGQFPRQHNPSIKPIPAGESRAIPIMPPSEAMNSVHHKVSRQVAMQSTYTQTNVDKWGVQIGQAPEDIQREQNAMSYNLAKNPNYYSSTDEKAVVLGANQVVKHGLSTNTADQDRVVGQKSDWDGNSRSHSRNTPLHKQDSYVALLDAMQKPKGTITRLEVQGQWMDIEGQGLSLQPSPTADRWEKHDWQMEGTGDENFTASKSDTSNGTSQGSRSSGTGVPLVTNAFGKENAPVTPRGHQKAATEAFVSQINAIEKNESQAAKHETRSLRVARGSDSSRFASALRQVYVGNMNGGQNSPYVSAHKPITSPVDAYNRSGLADKIGTDQLSMQDSSPRAATLGDNLDMKGYSSVSIQNVHATGYLPHNLDGPSDSTRGAKSALNVVNQAHSPRLLHRATGNGMAWYGPFCREAIEKALEQNSRLSTATKHSLL